MDPEIYKPFFTQGLDGRTVDLLAGMNPLDPTAGDRWYGMRRVDGELTGMCLKEADAYIRATNFAREKVGLVSVDGLMSGFLARGLGYHTGDVMECVFGDVKRLQQDPVFQNMASVLTARWFEIYCSLRKSPRPKIAGDVLDVRERLASVQGAYAPLLSVDGVECRPVEWILGFCRALSYEEDEVWDPVVGSSTVPGMARSLRFFMIHALGGMPTGRVREEWELHAENLGPDVIVAYDWFRRSGKYEFRFGGCGPAYH